MASSAGSFMTSFANGFSDETTRKQMIADREAARADRAAGRSAAIPGASADYGVASTDNAEHATGGSYAPMRASDPADTSLTPYQRAALNAISAGESAGKYNIRYTPNGGETFDLAGGHPRIYENGPAGKSSAAGRYQFTWSTWKDIAGPDTPFTPENQDKYAWALAARDYGRRTGRNLDTDLQASGFTPEIAAALKPTWASLSGNGVNRALSTYNDSYSRYSAPAPVAAPQSRSLIPEQGPALSFGQIN